MSKATKRSPPEVWPAEVLARTALDPLARQLLIHEINDQLQAYARTANQVHFWRAWLVARRSGVDVPEAMLRTVARLAQGACRGGAPTADAQMERFQCMRSVWVAACRDTGQALDSTIKPTLSNKVAASVAKQYGIDVKALRMQWMRFWDKRASHEHERAEVYAQLSQAISPQR